MSHDSADANAPTSAATPSTGSAINFKRSDYLQWDDYFMATAILASQRSKDPNAQVGACIVDTERRIVAIGYNGFPRNCSDDVFSWRKVPKRMKESVEDPLDDKSLYVVHAEANAILNRNAASLAGTSLYVTLFPCNECAKLIIQSGIKNIYFLSSKKSHKTKYVAAKNMFDEAGVHHEKFVPKQNRIVLDFSYLDEKEEED